MLERLGEYFKPKLDESLSKDLGKLIASFQNSSVPAREVRLFGSVDRGKWPPTNDIDIFVVLDTTDQVYSCLFFPRTFYRGMDEDGIPIVGRKESQERENLRNEILSRNSLQYSNLYTIHLVNLNDMRDMYKKGDTPFLSLPVRFDPKACRKMICEMSRGRLLYKNSCI